VSENPVLGYSIITRVQSLVQYNPGNPELQYARAQCHGCKSLVRCRDTTVSEFVTVYRGVEFTGAQGLAIRVC
jgi:hypothetical protein